MDIPISIYKMIINDVYCDRGWPYEWVILMRKTPRFETTDEIKCPECGKQISIHSEICPHCEIALH